MIQTQTKTFYGEESLEISSGCLHNRQKSAQSQQKTLEQRPKNLLKVNKITLEQRSSALCSSVIF